MKTIKYVLMLFASAVALQSHADVPKYVCYQSPGNINQQFTGDLNCSGDDNSGAGRARKKEHVCMEQGGCAVLTDDVKQDVEKSAAKDNLKYADLNPDQVGRYIYQSNPTNSLGKFKSSHLICMSVGGKCPQITECQAGLFQALVSEEVIEADGPVTTIFPKNPVAK